MQVYGALLQIPGVDVVELTLLITPKTCQRERLRSPIPAITFRGLLGYDHADVI
jgi:hypothetical protein